MLASRPFPCDATQVRIKILIAYRLYALPAAASADDCSSILSDLNDAERYLRRASEETDSDSAKDYMSRARNALEEVAAGAEDCNCDDAASEFEDAATRARRAWQVIQMTSVTNSGAR